MSKQSTVPTEQTTVSQARRSDLKRITMVTTPGDGSCGIGTYARDLIDGIEAIDAEVIEIPQDDHSVSGFLKLALRAAWASPDVVHVQHEYGLFRRDGSKYPGVLGVIFFPILYFACALQSKDIVVTMHSVLGLDPDEVPFSVRLYLLLMHKLLAICSSHLIFLAPDCASKFRDHIALGPEEFSLLSHGVNTDVSSDVSQAQAKRRFGYDPEDTVIAIPGFIRPPKGHDIFIEVASKLPEYEFMVAGGARPKGEDFEFAEQIKSEAPDNVTVTGVLDDDDYWTALKVPDLAVLPYRVVTQSGTFNACATQELPILASDAEYFKRIASTWGTPETVDISDVDEVTKRIRQLLQDESRRTCLAETIAQYKQVNSFEQVGVEHCRIYHQMENSTKSGLEQSTDSTQFPEVSAACSAQQRVPTD